MKFEEHSPLDGKTVQARVYLKSDSKKYAMQALEMQQDKVSAPGVADSVVVLLAADQTDPDVAKAVGPAVRIVPGTGSWRIRGRTGGQNGKIVLADAVGQPLSAQGTRLTLVLREEKAAAPSYPLDDAWRVMPFDEIPVGEDGQAVAPAVDAEGLVLAGIVFSHPDYGTAYCDASGGFVPSLRNGKIRLPLVRAGSPARERAVTGQVLAPDGQPVSEAIVGGRSVDTPGSATSPGASVSAVCDGEGRFVLYPPDPKGADPSEHPILPGARFIIGATVPRRLELLPYLATLANSEPARIVLAPGDAFHTFAFAMPEGRLSGPALRASNVTLDYRPRGDKPGGRLPRETVETGGKVPYGVYTASRFTESGRMTFPPVTIDETSPGEIVFSPGQSVEYSGRVVAGEGGAPMAGALVLGAIGNVNGRHLADLTVAEWQAIHSLPARPEKGDPALAPVVQIHPFGWVTRTVDDGSWSVQAPAGAEVLSVLVCEQGFLSFVVSVRNLKPDENHRVTLPDARMYPAARLTITPVAEETPGRSVSVMPRWVITRGDNPLWTDEVDPRVRWDRHDEDRFDYDYYLKANTVGKIEVPAGVHLKVRLETPYDEKTGDLLVPTDVFLQQGESLDLGRQELPKAAPVAVLVTDESGAPAQGVPVRTKNERGWSVPHKTDSVGVATLYLQPGEEVTAGVPLPNRPTSSNEEWTVSVKATGQEAQPPAFTLKLSREAIEKALQPIE